MFFRVFWLTRVSPYSHSVFRCLAQIDWILAAALLGMLINYRGPGISMPVEPMAGRRRFFESQLPLEGVAKGCRPFAEANMCYLYLLVEDLGAMTNYLVFLKIGVPFWDTFEGKAK